MPAVVRIAKETTDIRFVHAGIPRLLPSDWNDVLNQVQYGRGRGQILQMDIQQLHEANRAGWNEGAAHYAGVVEQDIAFLRAGGKNFVAPEFAFLADLSDWCGRAIHLQCAGGRDTLSLWNQGAREVVG